MEQYFEAFAKEREWIKFIIRMFPKLTTEKMVLFDGPAIRKL